MVLSWLHAIFLRFYLCGDAQLLARSRRRIRCFEGGPRVLL
jgi:hypothetical protein